MLTGGVADKVGNGFEAVWSMLQLLRLARDQVHAVHFEPIEVGDGFEFLVDTVDGTEWHQCKRRGPANSWSVAGLRSAGFLSAVTTKWQADPTAKFWFVSATPATVLDVLTDKARLTATLVDFQRAVDQNKDHRAAVKALLSATGQDEESVWRLLQRLHFEVASDVRLDTRLATEVRQLIHGDTDNAIRVLRNQYERSLTRRRTPDEFRRSLQDAGLRFREASIDPTSWDRLRRQNQLHLSSFGPFGVEGRSVPRNVSTDIADRILNEQLLQTIAVTGPAGAGKSGVLRQVAAALLDRDVPCLQIRIDSFLECATSEDVGARIFGLDESPCRTLASLAEGRRAVLIVDQLDAVSEVGGRQAAAKELVFALLNDAAHYPAICVVLGCRTYDFENDRRFSVLAQGERGLRLAIPLLDFESETLPFLQQCGIDASLLSNEHRTLAQLPLNLVLLIELHQRGGLRELATATTTALYDLLLRYQSAELTQQGVAWSLDEVLGFLARWMSDNEELSAPEWVCDRFVRAVPLLTSLHLLVPDGNRLRFFHDTLFDYAFARDFVRQGIPLVDWLAQRVQLLFRRTQVRQVLDLLRSTSDRLYLSTLRSLLHDSRVRIHIKDMIARWLAASDAPTLAELDTILSLDTPTQRPPLLVERAIAGSAWITLLADRGHLADWLDSASEERRQFALWLLKVAAEQQPDLVAGILRQWWKSETARGHALREWMRVPRTGPNDNALADLYIELIAECPSDRFPDDRLPAEADIGQWAHVGSPNAIRIFAAWLSRWFDIHPVGVPFNRHHGGMENGYWLSQLAEKFPVKFVENLWPWIREAMRRETEETPDRHRRYGSVFWRDDDDDDDGSHGGEPRSEASTRRIFFMIRAALKAVSRDHPDQARAFLAEIDPQLHDAALHLHLEAISANPALADLLTQIESAPHLFDAGSNGAEWNSIARALSACWGNFSPDMKARWEGKILDYWPELGQARAYAHLEGERLTSAEARERVIWRLRANGSQQRAILTVIGSDTLSRIAQARLAMLDRKFPGVQLPHPHRTRAGYVRSPIEGDALKYMKVGHWLSAMERYRSPEERHFFTDEGPVGGSEQLARALEGWCKERPTQAADLLRQMSGDALQVYYCAIVTGVASSAAELPIAIEIARFAAGFGWQPDSDPFPRFVRDQPGTIADDEVFSKICVVAADPIRGCREQLRHSQRDTTLEVLVGQPDSIAFAGSLTDQGQALEALAAGVTEVPHRLNDIATLAERLTVAGVTEEVRAVLAGVALSIATIDPDRGLQLLDKVTVTDAIALGTRQGMRLVFWALSQRPSQGENLLERLLASKDQRLQPAALWMLGRYACRNDAAAARFEALWPDSLLARRMAARLASGWCGGNESLEPRAVSWLERLYQDPDNEVCREAAASGRALAGPDRMARNALGLRLAASRAFRVDPDDLLVGLREVAAEYPEVVIAAARAYFAVQDDPSSELHSRGHTSGYTLTQTVLAAYRHLENDPKYRHDALDIIDGMVQRDSFGIRDEIMKIER